MQRRPSGIFGRGPGAQTIASLWLGGACSGVFPAGKPRLDSSAMSPVRLELTAAERRKEALRSPHSQRAFSDRLLRAGAPRRSSSTGAASGVACRARVAAKAARTSRWPMSRSRPAATEGVQTFRRHNRQEGNHSATNTRSRLPSSGISMVISSRPW